MWLGLSPIEPGTCLSHGIWDFSDSLCCVTNCWCREGRGHKGPCPAALVTAHCLKVGNSLVCLDIKHVKSCCQSAYKCMSYLSLVAFSSCLCIAFWSWYEGTCFPLWREACAEEIVSQSKQKSWIRGFWLAFPLSWVFNTLFFLMPALQNGCSTWVKALWWVVVLHSTEAHAQVMHTGVPDVHILEGEGDLS